MAVGLACFIRVVGGFTRVVGLAYTGRMINRRVLVSGAEYFADDFKINPYYSDVEIDVARACREHAEIVRCFREAGIEVVQVRPPERCQDGVYTANWAVVDGGRAVMSRLPAARRGEEAYAKSVLAGLEPELEEIFMVPRDYWFSGQGDALVCGKYLLAGRGYRSDRAAQKFVAETLGLELVQLHAIPKRKRNGTVFRNPETGRPDSYFYDLDLAVAVIDERTIAYCPLALDWRSRVRLEALAVDKILVDYEEAFEGFACNLVSTGEVVVMSGHAPRLRAELERRGLRVLTPEVEELKKGGGYIRCISLSI